MSGVVRASADISRESMAHANEVFNWAKNAVSQNSANISGFVDKITSDSNTARGMIQDFQNVANNALGIQSGAINIRDAALQNAAAAGDIQSRQMVIQNQQLGEQGKQLGIQQKQLGVEDAFRGDQQAQQAKADQLFDQYKTTYNPAMARYMADAEAYGSPERAAQARAGAAATVGEQFQGARDAAERQLQSLGMETRVGALDMGTRIKEAAVKAAAMQKAQQDQEAMAFQLRDQAIKQGAQLPGQATAATNAATSIGSNVVGAANAASTAGNVAANYGSLANQAGANAIGAGNMQTGAINAATGATNAATTAGDSATRANTGALAANTAATTGEVAAGTLTDQSLATQTGATQAAAPYLGAANTATGTQGRTMTEGYKNQLDAYKAQNSASSGLGALAGAVLPIAAKALMTDGASGYGPGDSMADTYGATGSQYGGAGEAMVAPGTGGSQYGGAGEAMVAPGTGGSQYGGAGEAMVAPGGGGGSSHATAEDYNPNLFAAEGGAIPMSTSPSNGQQTDDVKAMLNAGEFIIPRDVTSWYGEKFLQNLIQKAQAEKSKAQAKPAVGPMPAGPPAVASGPAIPMGAQQ
jgi:hypothetical protein